MSSSAFSFLWIRFLAKCCVEAFCDDQIPGTRGLDVLDVLDVLDLLLVDQVPRDVLRGGLPAMISFQVLEVQLCLLLGQVL